MSVISEYARNIAIFLIFISFIGIIMPSETYKKYINLVSGFVLMMIVIIPIGKITIGSEINIDSIYSDMEIKLNKNIIEKEKEYYEELKLSLVLETYKADIETQMRNIIGNRGFTTEYLQIEIDESDENFGNISYIEAIVSEKTGISSSAAKKLISIDKIEIGPALSSVKPNEEDTGEHYEESVEIKNLKNYFSDFYNLSVDNIYIKEQMNMD